MTKCSSIVDPEPSILKRSTHMLFQNPQTRQTHIQKMKEPLTLNPKP